MAAVRRLIAFINRYSFKALWLLTAAGVLASLPLMSNRIEMESSSDYVEFVFDYRDLLDISEYHSNPEMYVDEQVLKLREAGVTAMAVYESTLSELEQSGGIKLYSAEEAAMLVGDDELQRGNHTYLLYSDAETAAQLDPIIREGFALFGIDVHDWSYQDKPGLAIDASRRKAEIVPLDPDPIQMSKLRDLGFRISVRLSDTRPYDHARMDALLARLKENGADVIIFAGRQVTGFSEDRNKLAIRSMAELVKRYGLRIAVIEMPLDRQQRGMGKLASLSGYSTVRLHSILEQESFNDARVLADRYVLAVKDRNFRMIYLNSRVQVDRDNAQITDSLHNLAVSLKDPDFGAIPRIEAMGFKIGPPQPFENVNPGWERPLKLIVMIGAAALIARMLAYFVPAKYAASLLFVMGLVCTAGLYVLSPTICMQALALLAAISAPTAAVIMALRTVQRRFLDNGTAAAAGESAADARIEPGSLRAYGFSLGLFARTVLLSLAGAVYIVALLNHISYLFVLNQFRGVSVLHILPILLVAVYVMFYFGAKSFGDVVRRFAKLMLANIQVIWVAAAAVGGVIFFYYLTRTGNQAVVLPFDRAFRSMLENTLGVRPRTKELLAHPLFILGVYWLVRYGRTRLLKAGALALVTAGTMAMLSIVDTFAHLHTPMWVSSVRVLYGVLISAGISLIYYAVWELLARGWRRWRTRLVAWIQ